MKWQNKLVHFTTMMVLLLRLSAELLQAQPVTSLSGTVVDAESGSTLSYATVYLKHSLSGTYSNTDGYFELKVPEELREDTLAINYLGYKPFEIALQEVRGQADLRVQLEALSLTLEEVIITPHPPTYYIRRAIRNFDANLPEASFNSIAYYKEKLTENGQPLHLKEGIFKNHHDPRADSNTVQHQLLLFREVEDPKDIQFMHEEIEMRREKGRRKAEKKGDTTRQEEELVSLIFGGPATILRLLNHPQDIYVFDTTKFRKFDYWFEEPRVMDGRNLMGIGFQSKRVVEHTRPRGTIYLDTESYAIVRVDYFEEIVVPLWLRPLLFTFGLKVQDPTSRAEVRQQYVQGQWYPAMVHMQAQGGLKKNRWFKPDEQSQFGLEILLVMNELMPGMSQPIDPEHLFDPKQKIEEQIYNDMGVQWSEVSTIQE